MSEISEVNSEAMATQALLVGLMLALKAEKVSPQTLETAFEFAAMSATAHAMTKEGRESVRTLQIIDDLKEIVLPHKHPQ